MVDENEQDTATQNNEDVPKDTPDTSNDDAQKESGDNDEGGSNDDKDE